MTTAGQVLRHRLRRAGLSQREAAIRLNASEGNLSNIIYSNYRFPNWLCMSLEEIGIEDRYFWLNLARKDALAKINDNYDSIEKIWKQHERT